MKLATFNINGIKARLEALTAWLHSAAPDVACLQEIKCVDEAFPKSEFEDLGYNVAVHGQKGFNGVALLSKLKFDTPTGPVSVDANRNGIANQYVDLMTKAISEAQKRFHESLRYGGVVYNGIAGPAEPNRSAYDGSRPLRVLMLGRINRIKGQDLLIEAPGTMCLEGIPDMALRWKGEEIRHGWEPGTRVVLGDLYGGDGTPVPMCPRGALKRAVAGWEKHGLTPKVGIELEAYARSESVV